MPLSADLVGDILELDALMEKGCTHEDAACWIQDTPGENSSGSWAVSASDRLVARGRPRQREDPSSGRGNNKRERQTTILTTCN